MNIHKLLPVHFIKGLLILVFSFSTLGVYGQTLTEKVGQIEVQKIQHSLVRKLGERKVHSETNEENTPDVKMYYNSKGLLLKSINYVSDKRNDLLHPKSVEVFEYNNEGTELKLDIWISGDDKNLSHSAYHIYHLDRLTDLVISHKIYSAESDSLISTTYGKWIKKGNKLGATNDWPNYQVVKFDNKDRIRSGKQFVDNQLKRQWKYSYAKNQRKCQYKSYNKDGKNYKEKEVLIYNEEGQVIEKYTYFDEFLGLDDKTKYFYDSNGLIKKIEVYNPAVSDKGYDLMNYWDIEVKSQVEIDPQIATKINKELY